VAGIAIVFFAVGIEFGANGITMVAMCESLGAEWSAGLILAVGSVASMLGAGVYGARQWHSPLWKRFVVCLVAQTGASALFLTAHSFATLTIVSFLSGVCISPSFVNGNALIQRLVPAESLTEGLTWIGTALGVGMGLGSSAAGSVIDQVSAHAGYWVLTGAAAAGMVIALASVKRLRAGR
jgi:MFS family permease